MMYGSFTPGMFGRASEVIVPELCATVCAPWFLVPYPVTMAYWNTSLTSAYPPLLEPPKSKGNENGNLFNSLCLFLKTSTLCIACPCVIFPRWSRSLLPVSSLLGLWKSLVWVAVCLGRAACLESSQGLMFLPCHALHVPTLEYYSRNP